MQNSRESFLQRFGQLYHFRASLCNGLGRRGCSQVVTADGWLDKTIEAAPEQFDMILQQKWIAI
jgi:hypothetical protein